MLFGKLFTTPKMWVNGDANDITMGGVYTCKDVQNVPTGDGALLVFKTEDTVKQVFVPVGEEGVVYTRVLGEEWASVTGTSEETEALIQSAIDRANQAQVKADTVDTRLNNIILESGTSDAEVVAARTDSDGQTFTTLGVRLDTQFGEIKEDLSVISDLNSSLVTPLSTAERTSGGVTFSYNSTDKTYNVKSETVVTDKNQAWKNLVIGTNDLHGMIAGNRYYVAIEKTGTGAETIQVWYRFYLNGSQSGNSRALYNSGFIEIPEWATGIVIRIAASVTGVAVDCNIRVTLSTYMTNSALQNNTLANTEKINNIQPTLNILTLGDSIALGARNGGKGFVGDLEMPYVNIAVSGASISTVRTAYKNVFTQLLDYQSANPSYNPDCIVANGGINDYISGAPMGEIPDTPAMNDTEAESLDKSTLMGATGYLFYQMIKLYPRAQRFFVIIHKIKRGENDIYYPTHVRPGIDYTQETMHDAIAKICSVYGVKVIDVYRDSMMNTAFSQYVSPTPYSSDNSVTDLYFADTDGLHPLALGYKEAYVPLVKIALMGATKK